MQQSTGYQFYNEVLMSIDRGKATLFQFFNNDFHRNMLRLVKTVHKQHVLHIDFVVATYFIQNDFV